MSRGRKSGGVMLSVAIEGGLGIVAILIGIATGHLPWTTLNLETAAIVTGAFAAVPMLALFSLMWKSQATALRQIRLELEQRVIPLFRACSLADLALVCTAAGLGEELLFRGLIQGGLAPHIGTSGALLVASVLFGVAHPITPTYIVAASMFGGYLGWVWLASGNLLVPVVAHALYDFVALAVLLRRHRT